MSINMGKDVFKFSDMEIQKQRFHFSKKRIHIGTVDTNKIVVSEVFTYREKWF